MKKIAEKIIDLLIGVLLKFQSFRYWVYKKAIAKTLRSGSIGRLIIKNLNIEMANNVKLHDEFISLLPNPDDYQKVFWECDLGFLWYQGNLKAENVYFNFGAERVKQGNYNSALDVGCGWGRFNYELSTISSITKSIGIDISQDLIIKANELYKAPNLGYKFMFFTEVKDNFDLITFWGSTDYIPKEDIKNYLLHAIDLANKEVLMVNSLRNVPFNEVVKLTESKEIKRYDKGYIHPLYHLMEEICKEKNNLTWEFKKFGKDSGLLQIIKNN